MWYGVARTESCACDDTTKVAKNSRSRSSRNQPAHASVQRLVGTRASPSRLREGREERAGASEAPEACRGSRDSRGSRSRSNKGFCCWRTGACGLPLLNAQYKRKSKKQCINKPLLCNSLAPDRLAAHGRGVERNGGELRNGGTLSKGEGIRVLQNYSLALGSSSSSPRPSFSNSSRSFSRCSRSGHTRIITGSSEIGHRMGRDATGLSPARSLWK